MISRFTCPSAFAVAALVTLWTAGAAFAQDSLANGSTAIKASGEGAGALTASGVQTATAASVVPASGVAVGSLAVGSVAELGGKIATRSAIGMSQAAGDSAAAANGPLPVAKEVIVAPQPAPKVPYDAPAQTQPKP
jgi:hypothetical protein